ncbi:toll/interleukin-1 receptor domain-containing protein [Marinicella sp. W31]|uniref:toll/interleukin-1 receptor domain-containing protein n=1 Tax=Marinicella sp. W31 TaxID=3023713 RepID=UPI003758432B
MAVSKYYAFISYRHADNKKPGRQWATWLHQAIETYEVPADLVGKKNGRGETIPSRIFPIFRDEEELPADADLGNSIISALESTKILIVLCSPNAVASTYVADEIDHFKKFGHSNRIIAGILYGEPNASWNEGKLKNGFKAEDECFPTPLQFEYDENGKPTNKRAEPIAADLRINNDGTTEQGWTTIEAYKQHLSKRTKLSAREIQQKLDSYQKQQHRMLLKIIAGILGVPLGELTQRDKEYQLELEKQKAKKLKRWLSIVLVLAIVSIAAVYFASEERKKSELALNDKIHSDIQLNINDAEAAFRNKSGYEMLKKSFGAFNLSSKVNSTEVKNKAIALLKKSLMLGLPKSAISLESSELLWWEWNNENELLFAILNEEKNINLFLLNAAINTDPQYLFSIKYDIDLIFWVEGESLFYAPTSHTRFNDSLDFSLTEMMEEKKVSLHRVNLKTLKHTELISNVFIVNESNGVIYSVENEKPIKIFKPIDISNPISELDVFGNGTDGIILFSTISQKDYFTPIFGSIINRYGNTTIYLTVNESTFISNNLKLDCNPIKASVIRSSGLAIVCEKEDKPKNSVLFFAYPYNGGDLLKDTEIEDVLISNEIHSDVTYTFISDEKSDIFNLILSPDSNHVCYQQQTFKFKIGTEVEIVSWELPHWAPECIAVTKSLILNQLDLGKERVLIEQFSNGMQIVISNETIDFKNPIAFPNELESLNKLGNCSAFSINDLKNLEEIKGISVDYSIKKLMFNDECKNLSILTNDNKLVTYYFPNNKNKEIIQPATQFYPEGWNINGVYLNQTDNQSTNYEHNLYLNEFDINSALIHESIVVHVQTSKDNKYAFSIDEKNNIYKWSLTDGNLIDKFKLKIPFKPGQIALNINKGEFKILIIPDSIEQTYHYLGSIRSSEHPKPSQVIDPNWMNWKMSSKYYKGASAVFDLKRKSIIGYLNGDGSLPDEFIENEFEKKLLKDSKLTIKHPPVFN